MTAAEKLYQLIQTLPADQVSAVLDFAEFLHQKQLTIPQPSSIQSPEIPSNVATEQSDPLASLRNSAFIGCITDDPNLAANSETIAHQILSQTADQPL